MLFPKKIVGVDIGTSAIKVVELSSWGKTKTLEHYGETKSNFISKEPLLDEKNNKDIVSKNLIAGKIREVFYQAKIKTKAVIFSVPDFSTFSTSFDIPPMPEKEIAGAIYYNASQYITLPLSEVTLDWRIIPNSASGNNSSIKIFVVAVPNQVINDYQAIAKNAGLELYALEAEVFGITKALVKDNRKTICLVDMGAKSSTLNIVDRSFLKRSYSFSFNSDQLAKGLSSALGINYSQAEEIKNREGLNSSKPEVAKNLYPLIDALLTEVKNISDDFFKSEKKQVEEIYLTGGTANLPGLKEYFAKSIQKQVSVPNCFSELSYAPPLKEKLKEISSRFSAAVGVALDGLEI